MLPTVAWEDGVVVMIDQRRLPSEEVFLRCRDHREVAAAIRDMVIRGAPAIGVAAAFGLALGVRDDPQRGRGAARRVGRDLPRARPRPGRRRSTCSGRSQRMRERFDALAAAGRRAAARGARSTEARAIEDEDLAACRRMGDLGAALLPAEARVLTHCNAGALATAGYGTALGVIRSAARPASCARVFADETRPFLQGARLTAWELMRDGIRPTLITDGMAGHLMARGEIDAVVVGADRIAANGDVANKIGTYTVAVLAREHGIPFFVAAPVSTFDLATPGRRRDPDRGARAGRGDAPRRDGASRPRVSRCATPPSTSRRSRFVAAIVCERGVARAPFPESLRALAAAPSAARRG